MPSGLDDLPSCSDSRTLLTSSDVKFILVKVGPIVFTIAGIVADRSSSDVCCTKYSFKRLAFSVLSET